MGKDSYTLKKRGGIRLTREEVQEIKAGRKKLRQQMRESGIKSRREFELTASSLGLYFDKPRFGFLWFFSGRGLWLLLGALALLVLVLGMLSVVTQMRGLFTINMSQRMFKEGYALSEDISFKQGTGNLFCEPALDVPCISIVQIPEDIYDNEVWKNPKAGEEAKEYQELGCFYYTFYIRNEGESTTGYKWDLNIESEDQNVGDALWVMVFEDDEMMLYARANKEGEAEALPGFDDDSVGYKKAPFIEQAKNPERNFEVIKETERFTYYRVVPDKFLTDTHVASGQQEEVDPLEIHKYTVVIWIEGADPECTDDLIGGHAGLGMHFSLIDEEESQGSSNWWDGLQFWKN